MPPSPHRARPSRLRIGMIGAGTVGGGVYELITNRLGGGRSRMSHCESLSSAKNTPVITKICVRDASKLRDFHVDTSVTQIVTDVRSIVEDEEIDLVVEVAGGVTFAKEAVYASIRSGKSVVTANKALIAENLDEIVALLEEGNSDMKKNSKHGHRHSRSRVRFGYEASVCGGTPIIHVLQSCYRGDIINEVMGICNGTTNYMLEKIEEGCDFDEVLDEVQRLGFAEADPTADVEGHDVRAKIVILAKLAFGTSVPVDSVPCTGIRSILAVDFAYARSMGCTIKLIGTAARQSRWGERDGALSVYVSPKLIPEGHPLASATGPRSAVLVDSANLGTASYIGPGGGRYAAANSIVADVMRAADGGRPADPFPLSSDVDVDADYESRFYVRISFQDGLGIVRRVGELAESAGVSIHSILQRPISDRMAADTVVTTEACKMSQVRALCDLIEKEDFALCAPVLMPMISDY